MDSEQRDASSIPPGTAVFSVDGSRLGIVREAYPHYVLVDQASEHEDLMIPAQAILSIDAEGVRVSINRDSSSAVDHEETVHHQTFRDNHAER